MRGFVIGLLIGLAAWPIGVFCYLRFGHPPVAVTDPAFPFEAQIVHVPLHDRVEKDMPKTVPIQPTEENLLAGAQTYFMNCAGCHGAYNKPASFGKQLYPRAPQLWQAHGKDHVVGVSDDPAGETYWKIKNGIRLTAMPTFDKVLSPTEMWQVSVLLANANKPLPQSVKDALSKQ
jgi:thiosulfate dehydrogenase